MNIDLLFKWVLTTTAMGSLLTVIILLAKWIFKSKFNANWHYYIWVLLIIRLAIPFGPESAFSIHNIFDAPVTKNVLDSVNNKMSQTVNQDSAIKDLPNKSAIKSNANIINNNNTNVSTVNEKTIDKSNTRSKETGVTGSNNAINNISSTKGSLMSYLGLIWLTGALLMFLYILAVNIRFNRVIRRLPICSEDGIIDVLNKCKSEMAINSKVLLFYTTLVKTPSLYGILRHRILIPKEVINKLSAEENRYVLLHELAHLKRKDILVNWLTILIQTMHWFNPVIWYAFYKMRQDGEVACDSYVLSKIEPREYRSYGETLLDVLQAISKPYWATGTTGMTNSKKGIKERIARIAKFKKKPVYWTIIAVVLIGIIGFVGLTNSKVKEKITPKNNIATVKNLQSKITKPKTSFIYTNDKYGFSLTFPSTWKDYSVYEYPEPFKYAEASYSFDLPSKEKGWEKTKVQAIILTIYTPENYQKFKNLSDQLDYSSSVIYQGKYVYVYTQCPQSPNDVRDRLKEVPSILKTFKVLGESKLPSPQPTEQLSPADVLKNLQGVWIREEYINTLLKTKSPLQAINSISDKPYKEDFDHSINAVELKFQIDGNGKKKCLFFYDFHQGDNQDIFDFTLISGNRFNLKSAMENMNSYTYNRTLTVDDLNNPTKLTWETKDGKCDFIKIKGNAPETSNVNSTEYSAENAAENSTEEYVNNIVLAGKYQDEAGQIYIFGQDRVAKWPQKTFNYRIDIDFVMDQYCYIWAVDAKGKNTGTVYTYEWKDSKLYMFNATQPSDGGPLVPQKNPILILEKIE